MSTRSAHRESPSGQPREYTRPYCPHSCIDGWIPGIQITRYYMDDSGNMFRRYWYQWRQRGYVPDDSLEPFVIRVGLYCPIHNRNPEPLPEPPYVDPRWTDVTYGVAKALQPGWVPVCPSTPDELAGYISTMGVIPIIDRELGKYKSGYSERLRLYQEAMEAFQQAVALKYDETREEVAA